MTTAHPVGDIENAQDLKRVMATLPGQVREQADSFKRQTATINESIKLYGGLDDVLVDGGDMFDILADFYDEANDKFTRAHAEQYERIERADPREAAWDISKNN